MFDHTFCGIRKVLARDTQFIKVNICTNEYQNSSTPYEDMTQTSQIRTHRKTHAHKDARTNTEPKSKDC